jgi:hypothetical protein
MSREKRIPMDTNTLFNLNRIEFVTAHITNMRQGLGRRSFMVISRPEKGVVVIDNDTFETWGGESITFWEEDKEGVLVVWKDKNREEPAFLTTHITHVEVIEN